jgi:hypothetical protein
MINLSLVSNNFCAIDFYGLIDAHHAFIVTTSATDTVPAVHTIWAEYANVICYADTFFNKEIHCIYFISVSHFDLTFLFLLNNLYLTFFILVSITGGSDKLGGINRAKRTLWRRTHVTYTTRPEPKCEAHHIRYTACRLDFWQGIC